jgi:hypothetical protein
MHGQFVQLCMLTMHATLAIIGDVTVTWPDAVISSAIMVIICSLRTKPTDVTLTSLSQMSKAILEYYNVIIRQEVWQLEICTKVCKLGFNFYINSCRTLIPSKMMHG